MGFSHYRLHFEENLVTKVPSGGSLLRMSSKMPFCGNSKLLMAKSGLLAVYMVKAAHFCCVCARIYSNLT